MPARKGKSAVVNSHGKRGKKYTRINTYIHVESIGTGDWSSTMVCAGDQFHPLGSNQTLGILVTSDSPDPFNQAGKLPP